MTTKISPNDKRPLPYGGSFSIQDSEIIDFIKKTNPILGLWDSDITYRFCKQYLDWIQTTKNNTIIGLENFKFPVYSNGTSEAFEMFYIKNKNRRFRCFKGEYIYHQLAWRNNWPDWVFIEDDSIEKNDVVVISLPFSDTGNEHKDLELILNKCDDLSVPVLIDCAYFGTSSGIIFNFNHRSITDITFSLSKAFPVAHARIGIRLTKEDDDDLMFVYDKINYNNRLGASLGLSIIEKYSPDYIFNKYRNKQKQLCESLEIEPSKTVLFGIDYHNRYPEYNRGGDSNRLCLHKHLNV